MDVCVRWEGEEVPLEVSLLVYLLRNFRGFLGKSNQIKH
jgi:hypothetical protein